MLSGRIGLNEPFCLYADSHSYWKFSLNPWLRAQIILWDRVTISHAFSESTEPRTEIDVSWLVKHGRKSWVLDVSESFVSSPSRILMLLLSPCSWQNQHATDYQVADDLLCYPLVGILMLSQGFNWGNGTIRQLRWMFVELFLVQCQKEVEWQGFISHYSWIHLNILTSHTMRKHSIKMLMSCDFISSSGR